MFKSMFKQNLNTDESQEKRRQAVLHEQRQKRAEQQDANREIPTVATNLNPKTKRRTSLRFKDALKSELSLQISEWLRECPKDLGNWVLVPCPVGQHCLVVATDRRTVMYSKHGRRAFTFRSNLPGDSIQPGTITILDCIYTHKQDAFYVLDALVLANWDLVEYEAQLRFFWLRSKFEEIEQLSDRSDTNQKPFYLLQQYALEDKELCTEVLHRFPYWAKNQPELDGFLFYHKEALYTCGSTTPLVCWLFPFMIPDVLALSVSPCYQRPAEYENPKDYMQLFEERLVHKKNHKRRLFKDNNDDINEFDTLPLAEENIQDNSNNELDMDWVHEYIHQS